jgi:hypothetical protein
MFNALKPEKSKQICIHIVFFIKILTLPNETFFKFSLQKECITSIEQKPTCP